MTQTTSPNRRAFLSSLMAAPLLTASCWRYDRYFTIEWDEEVELHDGRIIIVHIKRTFERVTASMKRSRWRGMLRACYELCRMMVRVMDRVRGCRRVRECLVGLTPAM